MLTVSLSINVLFLRWLNSHQIRADQTVRQINDRSLYIVRVLDWP